MSRDQTRNIETFKIRSKGVNEFEFHKHQAEIAGRSVGHPLGESEVRPQSRTERVTELMAAAHEKADKRKKRKGGKRTKG